MTVFQSGALLLAVTLLSTLGCQSPNEATNNATCPANLSVTATPVCTYSGFGCGCETTLLTINGFDPTWGISSAGIYMNNSHIVTGFGMGPTVPRLENWSSNEIAFKAGQIATGSTAIYHLLIYFNTPTGPVQCTTNTFTITHVTAPGQPDFVTHRIPLMQAQLGSSLPETNFMGNDPIVLDATPSQNIVHYTLKCTQVDAAGVAISGTVTSQIYYWPISGPGFQQYHDLKQIFPLITHQTNLPEMRNHYRIEIEAYDCGSNLVSNAKTISVANKARALPQELQPFNP